MANTWGQSGTTWGQNQWSEQTQIDVSITAPSQLTTSLGTASVVFYPGWGTLDWGENGWGSVDSATETLTGLQQQQALVQLHRQMQWD